MLPGIFGSLQAAEALKLLLGIGTPLSGALLHLDILTGMPRRFELKKRADCPACGESAKLQLATSALTSNAEAPEPVLRLWTAEALQASLASTRPPVVLDVRGIEEYAEVHIDGARCIPLPELAARLGELPHEREIVCQCLSGLRSLRAATLLKTAGFVHVGHLAGGLLAYAAISQD